MEQFVSLENFKKKIEELKTLKNDGHLFVKDYFLKLRNKIDIDWNKCRELIDDHYLEVIKEVGKIEKECRQTTCHLKENYDIEQFKMDYEEVLADRKRYPIDEVREWENASTAQFYRLNLAIRNLQSKLLLEKQYKFRSFLPILRKEISSVGISTKLEEKIYNIDGIKRFSEIKGARIISLFNIFNGTNWFVEINNQDCLDMGFFLYCEVEKGQEEINASLSFQLTNKNSRRNIVKQDDNKFTYENNSFGFDEFISFKDLFDGGFYDQKTDSINVKLDMRVLDKSELIEEFGERSSIGESKLNLDSKHSVERSFYYIEEFFEVDTQIIRTSSVDSYARINSIEKQEVGRLLFLIKGIKKFSEIRQAILISNVISLNATKWYVMIKNYDNFLVGCYLYREDREGQDNTKTVFKFELINMLRNSLCHTSEKHSYKFTNANPRCGCAEFISLKKLFDGGFYDEKNDSINIHVLIQCLDNNEESS